MVNAEEVVRLLMIATFFFLLLRLKIRQDLKQDKPEWKLIKRYILPDRMTSRSPCTRNSGLYSQHVLAACAWAMNQMSTAGSDAVISSLAALTLILYQLVSKIMKSYWNSPQFLLGCKDKLNSQCDMIHVFITIYFKTKWPADKLKTVILYL